MFKKLTLAMGAMFTASAANAGTLTEPAIEVVETVEAASSSSGGIILPLLLLVAVIALVGSSD
mgnify:CR=1 FL=1